MGEGRKPPSDHKLQETLQPIVITEISSAHGDKNSALPNSNEVIHGIELISQHSKKGQKLYKVTKNWRALYRSLVCVHMRRTGTYHARICARCTVVGAKTRAPAKQRIYWIGRPPNHLWISSQADLTLKYELNPHGRLVKDLMKP